MGEEIARILVFIPNWIGDAAMCTPALRAIHRRCPEAVIAVAGRAAPCALLHGLPWLSERFVLPKAGFAQTLRTGRSLRSFKPGLAVVFPHSFRSAWLAFLSGAKVRLGYTHNGRGLLLTARVAPYRENGRIAPIYMAHEYLDLVRTIGCEDDSQGLELRADPAAAQRVRGCLNGGGPAVGIAPGAAYGPSKLWMPERFAAVADALTRRAGARCVLLTGPGEEAQRDAVLAMARSPLLRCDDGKPTIDTLKATVSQLDLLICNDSGARHVAVAFGVPVVCLMGPTSPRYSNGPYEKGRVLRIDVDCGPCQEPVCRTDHRCMKGITLDWVVETAMEYLG